MPMTDVLMRDRKRETAGACLTERTGMNARTPVPDYSGAGP
jgi:hypothetical protein